MDVYELLTDEQKEEFRKLGPGMNMNGNERGRHMNRREPGFMNRMMGED